jgi:N-glycosylase/DNA lyase
MYNLVKKIEELKKSNIKRVIDSRMKKFEELGKQSDDEIFKELCFCFLTANYNAERGIRIQNAINDDFLILSEPDLAKRLLELGHRFPNARAKFIIEARQYKDDLVEILNYYKTDQSVRDWIVDNIKGIGMKEASHFLRNIGRKDSAIIDFHIIDLLVREGIIQPLKSKNITPKKYVEIENILRELSQKTNTNLGELDLYLWYEETGKVLK